jgi:hypothetical protein
MKRAAPPSAQKTPLKRQNASVNEFTVKKVLNFDDTPTQEDPDTDTSSGYYAWSTRSLNDNEIQRLTKAGWGDYLEPTEDDMKLAVLLSNTEKNEGREFLTIGHPRLDKFGFATFLDKIVKKPGNWEKKVKTPSKDSKKEESPKTIDILQQMQREMVLLRQAIQDLKEEIQPSLI